MAFSEQKNLPQVSKPAGGCDYPWNDLWPRGCAMQEKNNYGYPSVNLIGGDNTYLAGFSILKNLDFNK